MSRPLRLLALGDNKEGQYHPFRDVAAALREGLAPIAGDILCTEDRDELLAGKIGKYDAVLSYLDAWGESLSRAQMAGLLQAVASGTGFVAVHCGISPENPEYRELIGARFIGHPPIQAFHVSAVRPEHPVTEGIKDFVITDELYQMEFSAQTPRTVLLEARFTGESFPVAWTSAYGKGRIVYVALGHTAEIIKHPLLMKLIARSVLWAARQI